MDKMKKGGGGMETTTLAEVPMGERKSWIDVAMIQAGIMICVPSLMLGGMLVEAMSFKNAIISGVIGYVIVAVLFCLMGVIGSDIGRPTCVTAIAGFGRKGTRYIISTLIFISMIGWFAVQTSVCGNAFSSLIKSFAGADFPPQASMAIWGLIMLVTAVYGINALDWLNRISVPALFVITIAGTVLAVNKYGTGNLFNDPDKPGMTIVGGIVLTVSFMAAGCLAASDITRFQRTRRDTVLSSVLGVSPAGILMVVLGAVMTRVAQQYDLTQVFVMVGLPILGMIVLIAATWTTNTTNAYSGGINAVLMLRLADDRRWLATMVSGILGTVCALLGLADHFEAFLYILGDLLLPTMGVILADYWILGRGKPENFHMPQGFNWLGIVSWLAGYVVIRLIPQGIPFAQGILAAGLLYIILTKLIGRPQDKPGYVDAELTDRL